jgi:hypothetical protein
MMVLGVLLAIVGLALAIYSVPFVTVVAFVAFLLGLTDIIVGLRMARSN